MFSNISFLSDREEKMRFKGSLCCVVMLADSAVADKVIEAEPLNNFYELFSIFIVDHSLVSDHTYHNNFLSCNSCGCDDLPLSKNMAKL